MPTEMREYLGRDLAWTVMRSAAAVLLGVLALARPGITLAALVSFWGAYVIADGVLALVAAIRLRREVEGESRSAAWGDRWGGALSAELEGQERAAGSPSVPSLSRLATQSRLGSTL